MFHPSGASSLNTLRDPYGEPLCDPQGRAGAVVYGINELDCTISAYPYDPATGMIGPPRYGWLGRTARPLAARLEGAAELRHPLPAIPSRDLSASASWRVCARTRDALPSHGIAPGSYLPGQPFALRHPADVRHDQRHGVHAAGRL